MRFSVLSSGSKANCTFFEAGGTRILIDCGLSAKETEKRLLQIGIDPLTIEAVLVTHEHYDHVYGISTFTRRYKIPVYANAATARCLKKVYAVEKIVSGQDFWIAGLNINPFSIVHDAVDPLGYAVQAEGLKFVQLTDLGRVTELVKQSVTGANAIVLESNHDQEMLMTCGYPWELKQRISSSHGHLSNDSAGAFLAEMLHSELFHVVLGHLSENSNTPQLAIDTVRRYLPLSFSPHTFMPACVATHTPLYQVGEELGQIAV